MIGPSRPGIAIVNAALARVAWAHESALGKHLALTPDGPELEVVGVAADGKYRSLGEEVRPFIYLPLAQNYRPEIDPACRDGRAPGGVCGQGPCGRDRPRPGCSAARRRDDAARAPAARVAPDSDHCGTLLGALGFVTLALAVVGVYGVASYNTAQRTQEVGVRLAGRRLAA